jgi:hypothetical protein
VVHGANDDWTAFVAVVVGCADLAGVEVALEAFADCMFYVHYYNWILLGKIGDYLMS